MSLGEGTTTCADGSSWQRWAPAGRRPGWKPFLYHLSAGDPERRRTIKLRSPRRQPTILTAAQAQAILDACTHLRDRLLWALLWDSGVRIGEALGLRHEDLAAAEGELTVIPRVNDNRARAKSASPRVIPVSPEVIRLYADYLHEEYGDLDSDYIFVNLWGQPFGRPWTYPAVYDLVVRLRRVTGIDFDPHSPPRPGRIGVGKRDQVPASATASPARAWTSSVVTALAVVPPTVILAWYWWCPCRSGGPGHAARR